MLFRSKNGTVSVHSAAGRESDGETMENQRTEQTINPPPCTCQGPGLTAWRVFKISWCEDAGSSPLGSARLCPCLWKKAHHLVLPLTLPAQTDPHLGPPWSINHSQKGVLSLACQHSWWMEGRMTPSAHYMKERVSDRPDRLLSLFFFLVPKEAKYVNIYTRAFSGQCSTVLNGEFE